MRLLFLAPQPFYQERGTPIAVRLALNVIAQRTRTESPAGDAIKIDLLTYHEGETVEIPGVTLHRIRMPGFIARFARGVGPGVSLKKLICDVFFTFHALALVWKNRREKYHLVHAVEEGVFVALIIKFLFRIPYIYDMDSSLALQVTEKWRLLRPLAPVLRWLEKLAVKQSMAVAPVCDALCTIAQGHGARQTFILRDISLIDPDAPNGGINLRKEAAAGDGEVLALYVGNLEHYQGIDLLLESFAVTVKGRESAARLAIIGGSEAHCKYYSARAQALGVESSVVLLGPRPVANLGDYIVQADILVSPRIKGNNTPMKIYSYLHSGKAILATRLPTHTQVLDDTTALLAEPEVESMSAALTRLICDSDLRGKLGAQGRRLADERYTFMTFSKELNRLYDQVGKVVKLSDAPRQLKAQP